MGKRRKIRRWSILVFWSMVCILSLKKEIRGEERENEAYRYWEGEDYIEIERYIGTEREVEIPQNINGKPVRILAKQSFAECDLERVVIPEGVEYIAECTFAGARRLREVRFPESMRRIYREAFNGCISLREVELPSALDGVGRNCFCDCENLERIRCRGKKEGYHDEDGVLFKGNKLWIYPVGRKGESYRVPIGTSSMVINCIGDCEYLRRIYIPDTVKMCQTDAISSRYPMEIYFYHLESPIFDGTVFAFLEPGSKIYVRSQKVREELLKDEVIGCKDCVEILDMRAEDMTRAEDLFFEDGYSRDRKIVLKQQENYQILWKFLPNNCMENVKFVSSDPRVATVSELGKISAGKETGHAKVVGTDESGHQICVEVYNYKEIEQITFWDRAEKLPEIAEIEAKEIDKSLLKVQIEPENCCYEYDYQWRSSDPQVAQIEQGPYPWSAYLHSSQAGQVQIKVEIKNAYRTYHQEQTLCITKSLADCKVSWEKGQLQVWDGKKALQEGIDYRIEQQIEQGERIHARLSGMGCYKGETECEIDRPKDPDVDPPQDTEPADPSEEQPDRPQDPSEVQKDMEEQFREELKVRKMKVRRTANGSWKIQWKKDPKIKEYEIWICKKGICGKKENKWKKEKIHTQKERFVHKSNAQKELFKVRIRGVGEYEGRNVYGEFSRPITLLLRKL